MAMVFTWKGSIGNAIKKLTEVLEDENIINIDEDHKKQITSNLEKLKVRERSLQTKKMGDIAYK